MSVTGELDSLESSPAFPHQSTCLSERTLNPEELEKLRTDRVSDFKQQKLEMDAQKNWDLFYKRNTTNFFKDRHWITREFDELKNCRESQGQKLVLLEAGCGVGNCIFPLLEEDLNIFIYFVKVKQNALYCTERCLAFQCDLTKDDLQATIQVETVDVATLIFVLSAIHPDKMQKALEQIYKVLRPGGIVLFRDYVLYDHAMLRFKSGNKLGENFYTRQDGTRSFFFSRGHTWLKLNKKEGLCVPRVFLQSKFRKPVPSSPA
uniref:tRNA N(3)-cytidine methyltransferase n=1 Tax=Sinocyclocheilus anshuiensis TaxID=1608454 RepID=A0A671Q7P5_9TELE